ncbi:MAG: 16S rRNA (cytosine(967)-C(5))-methyltransferase RsmB [Myxococcota bacterium]|nr:16S rRNA (cytosine(967)-C(5))-methyltransferase RsmB [Myxococcota bacterium]
MTPAARRRSSRPHATPPRHTVATPSPRRGAPPHPGHHAQCARGEHDALPAPERRSSPRAPSEARALAFRVLRRVSDAGAYADLALRAELGRCTLPARDRALATELVYGTLRWRGRLDALLARVLARRLDALEPRVLDLLRLGAYQLVFCDRVPDAAAVSESVRLAHATGLGRAAGLVNAALRRLAREQATIALPALADDPLGHLVHVLSVPPWVATRWLARFGSDEAAALATALNQPAPRTLRVNRQRGSREALLAELRERHVDALPARFATDAIRLVGPADPARDPAFLDGRMTMQDEASQLVVELLDPQPGERVLDTCAAPGGKATACAERVGAEGLVVAVDRHERRLGLITRDAERLGLGNLRCVVADATRRLPDELAPGSFDRVLVDAPCSGLGAWRRNPDARWRVSADAPARLATVQLAILRRAVPLLARGGALVYSTCTLTPEENEAVIDALLTRTPELRRTPGRALPPLLAPLLDDDGTLRTWPHRHDSDGFFAVRLEHRT